jgi:hypothetical protein
VGVGGGVTVVEVDVDEVAVLVFVPWPMADAKVTDTRRNTNTLFANVWFGWVIIHFVENGLSCGMVYCFVCAWINVLWSDSLFFGFPFFVCREFGAGWIRRFDSITLVLDRWR